MKPFLSLVLVALAVPGLAAQDSGDDSLDAQLLLEEALLVSVDMLVSSSDGSDELWRNKVEKITIPGRVVTVGIEGSDSRLNVSFTPYPTENGTLLLVARNEIWVGGEYSNGLTTIPIAYRDEVYYYPLGRAGEGSIENPVEVRMTIKIVPYLDTLDEEARTTLESAFDSSTQFDLSGEGG